MVVKDERWQNSAEIIVPERWHRETKQYTAISALRNQGPNGTRECFVDHRHMEQREGPGEKLTKHCLLTSINPLELFKTSRSTQSSVGSRGPSFPSMSAVYV